jgi:hypothetical protein
MPKPADVEPTPDDLLASAIRVIQETWARNRKGPYGKQNLLQTIYQVYDEWSLDQKRQIGRRLVQHSAQTRRTKPHLLELLIQAALPKIKRQVVLNWSDAIRLGQACHVQPSKLRAFLFARVGWCGVPRSFGSGRPKKSGGKRSSAKPRKTSGRKSDGDEKPRRRLNAFEDAGSRPLPPILIAGPGQSSRLGRAMIAIQRTDRSRGHAVRASERNNAVLRGCEGQLFGAVRTFGRRLLWGGKQTFTSPS